MSFPVSGDEKQMITINDSSFKETICSYIYISKQPFCMFDCLLFMGEPMYSIVVL
jgi:hypothetical protein